jgi:hypothetical protein
MTMCRDNIAYFIAVAAVMFLPTLSILAFRRPLLDPLAH